MNTLTPGVLFFILVAGILPAVFWLWFWLREDRKKPEPRGWLILTFFVGALAIIPAFYLEDWAAGVIPAGILLIICWSAIEEVIKYLAAYLLDFHVKYFDEPEDAMIYLITVALGFAAFENTLFLLKSFAAGGIAGSAITATMRFLGATLLHVLASATLGGFITLSFCKDKKTQRKYTALGLTAAIALHAFFNYFIIRGETRYTLIVFIVLWVLIIGLLLFFERAKRIICRIPHRHHRHSPI